jgi:hypothetical protein
MGSNQSNTVRSVTTSLNENITNLVNEQSQTTNAQQSNANELSVNFKNAKLKGCSINLAQKIVADQRIKAISTFNSEQALQSMMDSAVDNTVKQKSDAVNGFLPTSFANQNNNIATSNYIKNIIHTNISNKNLQNIIAMTDTLNKNELNFEGVEMDCTNMPPGYSINSPQDIVVTQFVESVTGLITEALLKNDQIAKAVNTSEQTLKAESKGVSDAISALFSGWGMIAGVFVLGIIGVFAAVFVFGKSENIKAVGESAGAIATAINPGATAAKALTGGITKLSFYKSLVSNSSSSMIYNILSTIFLSISICLLTIIIIKNKTNNTFEKFDSKPTTIPNSSDDKYVF